MPLTKGQIERVANLVDELAACIHIAAKILNFGFGGFHPVSKELNENILEEKLGAVEACIYLLRNAGDLNGKRMMMGMNRKIYSINEYGRDETNIILCNKFLKDLLRLQEDKNNG